MSGDGPLPQFFDSNILVYLIQEDMPRSGIANALVRKRGFISTQVLNEIVNVARRKLRRDWTEIAAPLDMIRRLTTVVPVTIEVHDLGIKFAQRYNLSTYDAMIVAAASLAGCRTLYSEDMQHGQSLGPVRVVNPFVA